MISVIIPVYKVEKYLDECVKSVVDQTYKDLEIILVDDGSPDNCPKICDEWASKDKRIKVVHKKNGGLSSARNAGLAIANGDYIGFVDSDDFINETMYEDLMQIMLSNKKNIVVSSPIIRNSDGKFSPYVVGSFVYKDGDSMLIKDYMEKFLSLAIDATVWNKLFRRDFIKTMFREGRNNEDYLFMYYNCKSLFNNDFYFAVTDTPHYYYRDTPTSICHQDKSSTKRLFFDELYNIKEVKNDLSGWNQNLMQQVICLEEGKLIHACDQILKYPNLKQKRPMDCKFVMSELISIGILKKGRSVSSMMKIFLFRYCPSIYLLIFKIRRFATFNKSNS